jgi:hypothetical protein
MHACRCLLVVVSLEDAGVGEASVGAGGEQRIPLALALQSVAGRGHQAGACTHRWCAEEGCICVYVFMCTGQISTSGTRGSVHIQEKLRLVELG